MELMVCASEQQSLPISEQMLCHWARTLSALSDKLTDDELSPLIALGTMLYQRGFREFESGFVGEAMIQTLRDKK